MLPEINPPRNFSISDLESLSTIKAHTFRIWEKRYSIVRPGRSDGNFRNYSFTEIKHLLNISLLRRCGYKISYIANLNLEDLEQRISLLTDSSDRQCRNINSLIVAMYNLDAERLEQILDESIELWGIATAINAVIFPFMERVQLFSCKDQNREIHFVVTAIRRKLILAIENVIPERQADITALLFLPKGEHFDLMLLYFHYLLKKMGIKVWYLGTNISEEHLTSIVAAKPPDFLLTYVQPREFLNSGRLFNNVIEKLQASPLYIAGPSKMENSNENNIRYMHYNEMPMYLDEMCAL